MAWARPPGAPQPPSCPLEALEPREHQYISLVDKYGLPTILGLAGVIIPAVNNYYSRRPFYTGIWKHITLGLGLTYVGVVCSDIRREMINDRDDVLRQYIALHPEDFPPYDRKLFKDVLKPWVPRR